MYMCALLPISIYQDHYLKLIPKNATASASERAMICALVSFSGVFYVVPERTLVTPDKKMVASGIVAFIVDDQKRLPYFGINWTQLVKKDIFCCAV